MAKSPPPPEDPNARLVDNLLKGLPHAQPDQPRRAAGAPQRPAVTRTPQVGRARVVDRPPPLGVWLRVGLGVALAVALTQWPYARDCGWPLLGYSAAGALVLGVAIWASVYTWRGQIGVAHLLSQGLVIFALGLAASVLLPRVGYAREAATWRCGSAPAASEEATPSPTAPTGAPINASPPVDSTALADSLGTDSLSSDSAAADTTTSQDRDR